MENRLENLRHVLRFQRGELASHLDISRSMLDQVRKGARQPGPKLLRRIEEAEVEAGIAQPTQQHLVPKEGRPTYGASELEEIERRLDNLETEAKEIRKIIRRLKP